MDAFFAVVVAAAVLAVGVLAVVALQRLTSMMAPNRPGPGER